MDQQKQILIVIGVAAICIPGYFVWQGIERSQEAETNRKNAAEHRRLWDEQSKKPANNPPRLDYQAPQPIVQKPKVIEWREEPSMTGDRYTCTVSGLLQYNGERTISYAQVTFDIYDRDDNRVGSAFDNINNLSPGDTWKIKAVYFGSDGQSFRLGKVSGF